MCLYTYVCLYTYMHTYMYILTSPPLCLFCLSVLREHAARVVKLPAVQTWLSRTN